MRRFISLLSAALLLASVAALAEPLPQEIRDTLDKEYPGWMAAKASSAVRQQFQKLHVDHPPHLVWGDFDDDGKLDFAIQIARTVPGDEEQIAIAFLKRDTGYKELILESRGLDPGVYLWTKKVERPDAASLPESQRKQSLVVVAGGPTGDTTYIFQNGAFHELETTPTPDVPETSDPDTP